MLGRISDVRRDHHSQAPARIGAWAVTMLFSMSLSAHATGEDLDKGFNAQHIKEALYLVTFEKSGLTRGGVLDTPKKAQKKLELNVARLCTQEGFELYRYVSIGEIARDEELRWVVEGFGAEGFGGIGVRTEKRGNLVTGVAQRNQALQIVEFSSEGGDDKPWVRCLGKVGR